MLKTEKWQIGDHVTSTYNWVIKQPDIPNGSLLIQNGNDGSATTAISLSSSALSLTGDLTITGKVTSNSIKEDAAGNVGIGVTPASGWSSTWKAIEFKASGNAIYSNTANNIYFGANAYVNSGGVTTYVNSAVASVYQQYNGAHYWYTAPSGTAGNAITWSTAMTLSTAYNLLIKDGTVLNGSTGSIATGQCYSTTARQTASFFVPGYGASGGGVPAFIANWASGGWLGVGADSSAGDSTIRLGIVSVDSNGAYWSGYAAVKGGAYTNASDYRLKKNVETFSRPVLSDIENLRPVSYNMIQKDEDGVDVETRKEIGFIAHELQEFFPEFVTGVKDEMDGDSILAQAVDYSKFSAVLVKAIQELSARLAVLEQR